MKKTHLYKYNIPEHKSIASYCGAVIDKDDVELWSKNPESVTCGNCIKPANIKHYELKKEAQKDRDGFFRTLDFFRKYPKIC